MFAGLEMQNRDLGKVLIHSMLRSDFLDGVIELENSRWSAGHYEDRDRRYGGSMPDQGWYTSGIAMRLPEEVFSFDEWFIFEELS